MATAPWPECAAASLQRCLGMMAAAAALLQVALHLMQGLRHQVIQM